MVKGRLDAVPSHLESLKKIIPSNYPQDRTKTERDNDADTSVQPRKMLNRLFITST